MKLQEAFVVSQGQPIEVNGRVVHWTYWVPVRTGDVIRLRFASAVSEPVQGLGILAENCEAEVAGTAAKHLALWVDTAPPEVSIHATKARKEARIGLFNQWRDPKYRTTLYRLNDAGIEIQALGGTDGAVRLNCSDGVGPFDPNDLVIDLRVDKGLLHA